ncbi:DsbA family protein [Antrihabitans sp. YC2-6]|nr:DsbA family protein [Antrihabitans sp. YC2-6]
MDYHFDPMCPFAYQSSIWIREVARLTDMRIDWRFFSLEEINRVEGKKHPWERRWSYGWSLMRIAALLRRRDPELVDRWYFAIGHELHDLAGKPHDEFVARRLLTELGLDAGTLDEAIDDPTTHDDVRSDHQRVVDAGGFGVPTIFFPDGQALFGPVLVDPPKGDKALRLWDVVTGLLEFPNVYELQRPKGPAQAQAIAESLRPYVRGRDWVSINRGEVIDLSSIANSEETAR